jgi:hypothetical protein
LKGKRGHKSGEFRIKGVYLEYTRMFMCEEKEAENRAHSNPENNV